MENGRPFVYVAPPPSVDEGDSTLETPQRKAKKKVEESWTPNEASGKRRCQPASPNPNLNSIVCIAVRATSC